MGGGFKDPCLDSQALLLNISKETKLSAFTVC